MKPLVVDTSVWIDWSRKRHLDLLVHTTNRVLLMPAIVAMELVSGAKDAAAKTAVADLLKPFARHRRLLVPSYDDYLRAGQTMARLKLAASRVANDVLVVVLARRFGAAVLSQNHKDFRPIAALLDVEVV